MHEMVNRVLRPGKGRAPVFWEVDVDEAKRRRRLEDVGQVHGVPSIAPAASWSNSALPSRLRETCSDISPVLGRSHPAWRRPGLVAKAMTRTIGDGAQYGSEAASRSRPPPRPERAAMWSRGGVQSWTYPALRLQRPPPPLAHGRGFRLRRSRRSPHARRFDSSRSAPRCRECSPRHRGRRRHPTHRSLAARTL